MTKEAPEALRDKDRTVIRAIADGKDDTQKITQATTLETHEVRYSLQKLGEFGLIELEKPDSMVERVVNGQKRVFKAPTRGQLTDKGEQYLQHTVKGNHEKYENLSQQELVEKVHKLEDDIDRLENSIDTFREQIQEYL